MNSDTGYEYVPTDEIENALVPTKTEVVEVNAPPQMIAPDALPDLENMDTGISLQAKYIEFEQAGQVMRGVFLGFTKMKNQQGFWIDVANFQNRDGVWVNAGANLVGQLRNIPNATPVQVKYLGKEDTKNGNKVKTFEVRLLNVKSPNAPAPADEKKMTSTDFWSLANGLPLKKEASEIVKRNTVVSETGATTNWNAAYKELKQMTA